MLRLLFISCWLLIGLTACSRSAQPQAAAIPNAVEASNREAKRLYQVEPFEPGTGALRQEDEFFFWEAFTSVEGNDFRAKVKMTVDGTVLDTHVRMLAHPDLQQTSEDPPKEIKPETQQKTIPEIMPK